MLSSFVSTAFEDVLSGLPISEQPYVHELRRGPPELAVLGLQRAPTCTGQTGRRHRSDRPAQGFAGVDGFDDRLHVLAHSSVFGANLCQHLENTNIFIVPDSVFGQVSMLC